MMNNESGAIAILTGIMLVMFLGFLALSVDTGRLMVTKNELQNAADAGALAGARELYNSDGSEIQISSNQIAYDTAVANLSDKSAVEVIFNSPDDNENDVQRGHWSFTWNNDGDPETDPFTPNASTEITELWGVSSSDLDVDTGFINAVRVTARRKDTPIKSFFARIFGPEFEFFQQEATAVAYLGFVGSLLPAELDLPLALCIDSLLVDDSYSCNIGRVINSGNDETTSETGRWTNFSSSPPDDEGINTCSDTDPSSNQSISLLFPSGDPECEVGGKNPDPLNGGDGLSTINGAATILSIINSCFTAKYTSAPLEKTPWSVTLPVIDCSEGPGCGTLMGAVNVIIVWITDAKDYSDVPLEMGGMEAGDDGPLYDDWGAPADGTTVADGGNEGNLYDFMINLDDYKKDGGEDWNKDLEKEFGVDWKTKPLADFFDVGDMSVNQAKAAGKVRWASFIRHFNLSNVQIDGTIKPAPFAKESVYFLPDCTPHETTGVTGGQNLGILSKIPVLVK